ncbi:MAG: LLM class flavin-dependent oxidoreductase [Streptosporangiales bacterium]|nr:LLM class flavin-dependent oxidoreductase [Streptosporangiales bacterium]
MSVRCSTTAIRWARSTSSPTVHDRPPAAAPGLLLWSTGPAKELIELVELADDSGYSELWYTDIRFQHECYMGLALAARHSRRLLLGPGVSDPYSRHPAVVAMAMATLDELSQGRVQIGLGTGGSGLAEMGVRKDRPVRALREAIELIRAMFEGSPVDYTGELYRLQGTGLGFTPLRRDVPVFVATHSAQVLRLSGKLADGVLLANLARRPAIDTAIESLRDGERVAGRKPGSVAVHLRLETCIGDDEDRALEVMRRRFAARLCTTYPRWSYLEGLGVTPTEDTCRAAEAGDVDAVASGLSAEDVRATGLVGSAATVVEQLHSLLSPEVAKVTIRPLAAEGDTLASTVSSFIDDVWPVVRGVPR